MDPTPPPPRFAVELPPELVAGVYADFASVWHSNDVFTLDFAVVSQPPQPAQDENGEAYVAVPTRIVSRVRIPPSQVFEIMKTLEQQLTRWEKDRGQRPAGPTMSPG